MSNSRWEQVKEIFQAVLESPLPERERFLSSACGGDDDLCDVVRDLLSSYESAGSFMDQLAIAEVAEAMVGQPENVNIGQTLGRYLITEKLGAGGMGEVFLAEDRHLERLVAFKLLSAEFSKSNDRIKRFILEAKAVSALNHPNILTIYEIGQFNDWHFIVTEFIKGDTLRQRQMGGRMPLREILDIAAQIAAALCAAHEAGIIHRDIKPENIMLRTDGLVKVLDFGISKLIEEKQKTNKKSAVFSVQAQTIPGMVLGTTAYMSPEQTRGLSVNGQTDVWSLGVVLYEMIAGKQPFAGETKSDTIALILTDEPAPLAEQVPAELKRIIGKSLQKKASERYQTINDFLFDLKELQKRIEFEIEQNNFGINNASGNPDSNPINTAENSLSEKNELPPNNLTENSSPFIGREKEIAEIKNLLRESGVRLLTLTGVGGTGKTRLARAVAQDMLPQFPDGVFFVELAAITSSELVAAAVASPLGVKEAGGKPIFERLKEYLRASRMLIVIDNFEQVIAAAPQIAELLSGAVHLKILITSRMILNLSAEREFVVAPLEVPLKADLDALNEFSKYESIELFTEHARKVKPNFALTKENARSIGEICLRLDGLPLAIELAAARVKILSPQMILINLENRLKFLTGGAIDSPARQQTMRDTISWSYELLTEDEKHLFRRLAVFAGGFTLEAAGNVSCQNNSFETDGQDFENKKTLTGASPLSIILDGIISLIDKSLLVSKERANGNVRFQMLEVVREYALEALTASGEEEQLKRNHASYFLALGKEAEPHLQAVQSVEWLDRLEEEHDNLRAALRWSSDREAAMLAHLSAAIRNFWILHSYLTEGREWLKIALAQSGQTDSDVQFKLLHGVGVLSRLQGDFETARQMHEEALRVAKAENNLYQIALSGKSLGLVASQRGAFTAAKNFYLDALVIYSELKNKLGIAQTFNSLGDLARVEDDYISARPFYEKALEAGRHLGNKQLVSANLVNMAAVVYMTGNYKEAHSHFAEALAIAEELGYLIVVSYSLDGLAALALRRGNVERAACLAGSAQRLRESMGYEIEPAERRFRDIYLTELRNLLSEADFTAAYEKGSKMKLEESVAIAIA